MTAGRAEARTAFLAAVGWSAATRRHLAGDASARAYERVTLGGVQAVLMDAPPGCGDDAGDFQRIAAHLAGLGLSPPRVLEADLAQGFLLIEDLGDDLFPAVVARDPGAEPAIYAAAAEVLARVQAAPAPPDLPDLTAAEWAASAAVAAEVYARAAGAAAEAGPLVAALEAALAAHADGPRVLILRDYHAGNLLWLPGRAGPARVGLLDFQLAQMGQPEYDLVSLVQDARRDVGPAAEAAALAAFAAARGVTAAESEAALAVLGALRALRILGVFARLCVAGGKPQYLPHLPRVWGQLQRNLGHPALARLAAACRLVLPEPTGDVIERIRAQCGRPDFR